MAANLKDEGWIFHDKILKVQTRYGTPTSPKEYWLDKKLTPLELYEQFLVKPVNKPEENSSDQLSIFAGESVKDANRGNF